MDVDHRDFDDIGGTALNGGIYRVALGGTTYHLIVRVDVFQIAPPAQNRLHVTMLTGKIDLVADKVAQFRLGLVIGFNEFFCLSAAEVGLVAKAKSRNAVNNSEVYRFGIAALLTGHLVNRYVEHF